MAKVSFTTLKLKVDDSTKKITIGDKEIEVKQYLNADEKYDLIMITLQECKEAGIYNAFKKEICFNLNLVYMYTNLSFTDKQKEDKTKLYDILESNNVFNQVIEAIPADEYNQLLSYLQETEESLTRYNTSIAGIVSDVINNLPVNAQAAMDMVNTFDPQKYGEVVNFAKAIGVKGI